MHWKLMKKAFSYFSPEFLTFTAVSPWLKDRFYLSPIVKGFDCTAVLNGLDVNIFSRKACSSDLLDRIGPNVPKYLLHVTASFNPESVSDVKGGYYLVELAKKMPERTFLIVCTTSRGTESLPANIIVWGKAKGQNELAQLYSQAQMTLIVSRRETFSMVTAESLCCGTPVVGFKAGGPESIAIKEASLFAEQGDVDSLAKAICEMDSCILDRTMISKQARDKYCSQTMAKSYLSVYNLLLNR
jgi:glycosyltransferase involved in cell wall biosynthesis